MLSSFSSILHGKLWDLLACHQSTPQVMPLSARKRCKLLAVEFSQALTAYRSSVQRALPAKVLHVMAPVRQALQQRSPIADTWQPQLPQLVDLARCSTIAVMVDGHVTLWGDMHSPATPQAFHSLCIQNQSEPVFYADNLTLHMGPDALDGQICGVWGTAQRA